MIQKDIKSMNIYTKTRNRPNSEGNKPTNEEN